MKHIVETYGIFFLSFVTVALIFGFVFWGIRDNEGNRGVFAIAGAGILDSLADSRAGSDFSVYDTESQKAFPAISCVAASACAADKETAVSELFTAQDGNGQPVDFNILSVIGPSGRDGDDVRMSEDRTHIVFLSPGIYTFEIKTQDAWNRERIKRICIPVNREG